MFVGLALVVLVVVRRPTVATRSWLGRARDGEQATYGSGNGASPPRRVQASGPKGKVEPHKLYPAPPVQLAPGAAAPARGLFHKVPAKPAAVAPAHNVLAPAPPAHDLEITSATDPDTARRFLLVGWMGEQETKAQQHLYQLGLLSLALNRTLVLPTVKRSRFGTCYNHPFSLYYAEDTLARFGIPYITSDDFWAWTDRQRSAPSAQVISLNRGRLQPPDENGLTPERMCLSERSLDFGEFASKAFSSPSNDGKSAEVREQFGINVVQTLLEQERTPDTDGDVRTPAVLVTDVHLRYPFLSPSLVTRLSPFDFPSPSEYGYMDYAEHWRTLGETIASSLSPFVAVHWRTETLPVETLRPCGDALVASLEAIKREHPEIKTVYLATDYPLEVVRSSGAGSRGEEKATAHSGTMTKTLTPAHHAAMRAFLGKIEGSAFRVTTFLEEQARVTLPDELRKAVGAGGLQDLDGAIVGIVDKIVLMQAESASLPLNPRYAPSLSRSGVVRCSLLRRPARLRVGPRLRQTVTVHDAGRQRATRPRRRRQLEAVEQGRALCAPQRADAEEGRQERGIDEERPLLNRHWETM